MQKILITGAGSGLGVELAKCYADDQNTLILVGRNLEKLESTAILLQDKNVSVDIIVCDISSYESVKKLSEIIETKYKNIDCLINNAGIGYFGPFENLKIDELNAMIDINIKGTIIMTQALLPKIKKQIINIISTAGLKGKVNEAAYVASKFAIRGFTESLQKELVDIKVTAVYMGGMDTPFWNDSTHIKDKSRLKSPYEVAREIKEKDDGREEIFID